MVETKSMTEQLAKFNKIIDDLANLEVNLEDEDKVLHLLCTLPKSYESFEDTLLYGRENPVTLEEVQSALRSKEITKSNNLKVENGVDALNVSSERGGGRGKKAKGNGHFKALLPLSEERSLQEGLFGEPEEIGTHNSGDACDGGELGDFEVVVSKEFERSCLLQGGDHGG
ncbi:cytochrome p450, partial [Trifolium pratense]